jgi:hypothetical protein
MRPGAEGKAAAMNEGWQAPVLSFEEWRAVVTALKAVGRRADWPLTARIAAALGYPPVSESEMPCERAGVQDLADADLSRLSDGELEARLSYLRRHREHPFPATQRGMEGDQDDSSLRGR